MQRNGVGESGAGQPGGQRPEEPEATAPEQLHTPQRYRLFVAITVPEEVKASLSDGQRRLRQVLPGDNARWTKPEQFHLTLRFLGNVEATASDSLVTSLRAACRQFGPLQFRAAGIGCFPSPRSPRVVWVRVTDSGAVLPSLWEAVQSATAGFTSEEPRFTGHITLARIKSIRPKEVAALATAGEEMAQVTFGEWTSGRIELIRSQLSPKGAQYTTLSEILLLRDPL